MSQQFYKFPTTPHLALLGDVKIRGDKVMSSAESTEFLKYDVQIEEKLDGANLGISFDSANQLKLQNRGAYLDAFGGQWRTLPKWINSRVPTLREVLSTRFILFGEWCYARHTVPYDRLPDWFLAFDLFDKKQEKFLASAERDKIIRQLDLCSVPQYARGKFNLSELQRFLGESKFAQTPPEGIYLRADAGEWLLNRAKLVCPDFLQSHREHWSHHQIVANKLVERAS